MTLTRCLYCGSPLITNNDQFCYNCGSAVEVEVTPPKKNKKKEGSWIVNFGSLLFYMSTIILYLVGFSLYQ